MQHSRYSDDEILINMIWSSLKRFNKRAGFLFKIILTSTGVKHN